MNVTRRGAMAGAAGAALLVGSPARAASGDPVARTVHGPVRGLTIDGVHVFKGVRYGADTRQVRFARPRRPHRWRETLDAFEYGPAAPQRGEAEQPQSEDCLFLNVWTPGLNDGGARPVMVYFHGGAYNTGSGSAPLYDGTRLARKGDVVVITVNHRLNAFGYLYLDRLFAGAFPDSGNAGQWDLVLALEWVRANARTFGGDPTRVMVFGQSGGGAKIATLMATPAAEGLFHSAATMSGQQVTASGPLHATARAEAYLDRLGLSARTPQALLALPMGRLIEALDARDPINPAQGLYFGPVLDERMLRRHPFWPDAPAQSADIPMILGNTKDETKAFLWNDEAFALSWKTLPAYLGAQMRCDIHPETVVERYRSWFPDLSPAEIMFKATTAGRSWRGQAEEADARAREAGPTWVYQFNLPAADRMRGAPHTIDIAHAFDNLDKPGAFSGKDEAARRVADQLSSAFIQLARRGDPNHPGLSAWPRYGLDARWTMVLDAESRAIADPRRLERELFAKVPFIQWGT